MAFFATAVVAVAGGMAALVWALEGQRDLHYLIPVVMALGFLLLLAILVGVYIIVWRDPTRLQVTQMTGTEFTEYQKLTLGDSDAGETIVTRRVQPGNDEDTGGRVIEPPKRAEP